MAAEGAREAKAAVVGMASAAAEEEVWEASKEMATAVVEAESRSKRPEQLFARLLQKIQTHFGVSPHSLAQVQSKLVTLRTLLCPQ